MAGERVIRRIVRRSWKVRTGLVSRTLTMLVTENVKASRAYIGIEGYFKSCVQ